MAPTEFATRSHKGAGFLFLMGFALAAAGVGFALAPHFSWQVTKIARQANALGLANGMLVLSGLVCFGLGIVARVAGSPAPVADSRAESEALQSELHLLNEQFSTKLAQIKNALLQVHEGVTNVAAHQQAQLQTQGGHGAPADQSQDAIFRLAASLDKLHAHLDERVHAVDLQLRSGFESLLNVSQDVRRHLAQGGFASAPASPSASPVQPHGGNESGIDFYETMQKLDAIAGEGDAHEQPPTHRGQPHPPFPNQGQGFGALMPEEYRDRY